MSYLHPACAENLSKKTGELNAFQRRADGRFADTFFCTLKMEEVLEVLFLCQLNTVRMLKLDSVKSDRENIQSFHKYRLLSSEVIRQVVFCGTCENPLIFEFNISPRN